MVACYRVRALSAAVHTQDLLKEVAIFFIISTTVWSQVKQQGGNTALPINRKLDSNLLSLAQQRKLSTKELMLLNCDVGENS